MKILFILEYYHPHIGGVERLFKNLTEHLVREGIQVSVLTNKFSESVKSRETLNGVNIYRLPFRNRYLFTFLAWIPAISLARHFDLIHTTSYNAALPARLVAILLKKKSVITFHERWGPLWFELPWMNWISKRLHYFFEWFITKLNFTKFVAVSDFTREALIESGIHPTKVVRIYNGLDYGRISSRVKPPVNLTFTFTFLGRLGYSKGLDILVKACHLYGQKDDKFKLNIVTSKEPKYLLNKIKKDVSGYGLEGKIIFMHAIPDKDLIKLISKSDAVIIPSYSEGFCFVAVETMAIGTPIISSGRGALKEVISGKHIHFDELSPQSLFLAMTEARSDKWKFLNSRKFPLQDTIKEYKKLYKKL